MKTLSFALIGLLGLAGAAAYAEEEPALKPLTEEQLQQKEAGERLANKIMSGAPRFAITGPLDQDANGVFRVNGEVFQISKDTRVEGELTQGAIAFVKGFVENGVRIARIVSVDTATLAPMSAALEGPLLDLQESQKK